SASLRSTPAAIWAWFMNLSPAANLLGPAHGTSPAESWPWCLQPGAKFAGASHAPRNNVAGKTGMATAVAGLAAKSQPVLRQLSQDCGLDR
ncbi:MAG: hypothetical protein Q8R56_02115, partial [Polaromonas sp.]|nr:hypothetical protein [Polaromonas sp.]